MSKEFETSFGEKVFCTELVSGNKLSGNFIYSDEGILTNLISFDGFFFIDPAKPIFLQTEKLEIVSLRDSFGGPAGTRSRNSEPVCEAHIQTIFSNSAIVGADEWRPEDRVKRISFCVNNSMTFLRNINHVDRLSMARTGAKDDDWLLLNLRISSYVVRLFYTATYAMWGNEPKEIQPRFEIEFDDAVPFDECLGQCKELFISVRSRLACHSYPST